MIDSPPNTSERRQDRQSRPGFGALLHDLISLIELQGKLLLKDVAELQAGAIMPIAMLIGGVVLTFATAPVLLLTLGWLLAETTALPLWAAMAISVTVGGIIPAGVMMVMGWKHLIEKAKVLKRSKDELQENTRWLKHRIKTSF